MTIIKNIQFIIDHIDPLGQGVYKEGDDIFFIPKTLPNETGTAQILKRKKGVHFAKVEKLDNPSQSRIKSECSHFNQCPGCHYLHCDYKDELEFKVQTYKKMLKVLEQDNQDHLSINSITAENRIGYRNRIQLHYNLNLKKLGFIDGKSNQIIEVPNCLICTPIVKKEISKLYKDNHWLKLAPKKPIGHVEIYDSPTGLNLSWNNSYAEGGFTQVNASMNEKLNLKVAEHLKKINPTSILDLFGGNGNLSNSYQGRKSIIDIYQKPMGKIFHSINLFEDNALEIFKKQNQDSFQTIIIDPPRKGFPLIANWISEYSPEYLLYISCHPNTMIRDLKSMKNHGLNYEIQDIYLLDLFPSTFHFEGMIILKKHP